jgi:small redox-active disulfide protein 2
MHVKVLGAGCPKCHTLEQRTEEALRRLGVDATVEMITDFGQIAAHGVMNTPAVVVGDSVVLTGRVPEVDELVSLLDAAIA